MKQKPNWQSIRLSYLNEEGSLRALAKKFGVPRRTLERRCRKEGWQQQLNQLGGATVAVAAQMARDAAQKLSLPERSVRLREKLVGELERDAETVSRHDPKTLDDAKSRQDVLTAVTRNAASTLNWDRESVKPILVRIDVLASARIARKGEPGQTQASPQSPVIDVTTPPEPSN